MDISTIIGLVMGTALILMSIFIDPAASFGGFISIPSVLIVLGGSMGAAMICFPLNQVMSVFAVIKNVFVNKQKDLADLIEQLVSLSETARRDGLLALENRLEELDDPFVMMGIRMAVDGMNAEVVEGIMQTEVDAVSTRHENGKKLLDSLGRFAPAFGMIGTLMGLIIMLGDMNPETIGSGMAVALLTTLYGAIVSNLVYLPFSEKLNYLNEQELLSMEIVVRGILAIQGGENPRVIRQKLTMFIPPKARPEEEEEV
jgi:chemotaxis protein MotA